MLKKIVIGSLICILPQVVSAKKFYSEYSLLPNTKGVHCTKVSKRALKNGIKQNKAVKVKNSPLGEFNIDHYKFKEKGVETSIFVSEARNETECRKNTQEASKKFKQFVALAYDGISRKNDKVYDNKNNLVWEDGRIASSNKLTHQKAVQYCKSLNKSTKQNWRLPTIQELFTIIDFNKKRPAINSNFYNTDRSGAYWSSTKEFKSDEIKYWTVDFYKGRVTTDKSSEAQFTRCVR